MDTLHWVILVFGVFATFSPCTILNFLLWLIWKIQVLLAILWKCQPENHASVFFFFVILESTLHIYTKLWFLKNISNCYFVERVYVANFMSLLTSKWVWIWSHYAFEVANCKNPAATGSLIKLHDGPCEELLPIVEAVEAEDEGNCPIFCTQEWRPVCGTDGK